MDLTHLQTTLQTQATDGTIVLNDSILTAAQVAQCQTSFGLAATQYLTIQGLKSGDVPDAANGTITLTTGTVAVLGYNEQDALPVKTITFSIDATSGEVEFVLLLQMPADWTFVTSAPSLTVFPFSLLTAGSVTFVYSTQPAPGFVPWPAQPTQTLDLTTGLNFGALLSISKLSILQDFLGQQMPASERWTWGPFNLPPTAKYPVLSLRADLGIAALTLTGTLNLASLALTIDVAEPASDQSQAIDLAVVATTSDLEFCVGIPASGEALTVTGAPLPAYVATLANLAQSTLGAASLPESTNFSNFVPDPLADAFETIAFQSFELDLALAQPRAVTRLTFVIGSQAGTSVNLGLFTLTAVVLQAAWTNPTEADSVTTILATAAGKIPLKVFADPVNFTLSITKSTAWAIDAITAQYAGPLTLTGILAEIAPNTVVPTVLQGLSFSDFEVASDPSGSSYSCSCRGQLACEVLSQSLATDFELVFKKDAAAAYTFDLTASFVVAQTTFALTIELSEAQTTSWQFTAQASAIALADLLTGLFAEFSLDLKGLPAVQLTDLTLSYNTPTDGLVAIDATFAFDTSYQGDFHLAAQQLGTPAAWQFVAAASLSDTPPLDLGALLPLVGPELAGDFELAKASALLTSKAPAGITLAAEPDLVWAPGLTFAFDLLLAGQAQSATLPVLTYPAATKLATGGAGAESTSASPAPADAPDNPPGTISVQKQLGPLFIDSIGVFYTNQVLACSLTASVALGPLSASLEALSFGSSLTAFSPSFSLGGLGFGYAAGPLTIEGAIERVPDSELVADPKTQEKPTFQFDGALIVQAEQWGLSALASYAQLPSGQPSLFIFVAVDAALGGPPCFVVEGLMGGFGYNRSLVLPTFDQVADFPLLAIGADSTGSAKDQALHTLQVLEGQAPGADGNTTQWIAPQAGDYWLAAGVKFTSFELVHGSLLLVAEFGDDLQFAVLGLASLSLPLDAPDAETYVYVELQMEAVLKPTDGFFGVAAALTNSSFVLTRDCHLTGGFAFYLWFGDNPNAGQFVLTAGGYHPAFVVPTYYPAVARLGFNWQVSNEVAIKGTTYFAVTPACGMAGGSLEAHYQSGDITAWFTAQADMLVTWHPFSFTADLSIELGAAVKVDLLVSHKTVSASVGAWLTLWGPPMGGLVKVHVVVVTVTIQFGSNSALDKSREVLAWANFQNLLPTAVCTIAASSGLRQTLKRSSGTQAIIFNSEPAPNAVAVWVVRAGTFGFLTQSAIPASALAYSSTSATGTAASTAGIDIRPMNLTGVASTHTLTITRGQPGSTPLDLSAWTLTPSQGNVPAALWGAPLHDANGFVQSPVVPSADVVADQLLGYRVQAPAAVAGSTVGAFAVALLQAEYIQNRLAQNPLCLQPAASASYLPASASTSTNSIGTIASLASQRTALYEVLSAQALYTGANDSLQSLATNAATQFVAYPLIYSLS